MTHPNEELVTAFYEAFTQRDGESMGEAYHDDATFSDPVFPDLDADGVRSMWAMLTKQGKDLRVEFSDVKADDERGSAHWEAWYTFSATGKKVHNVIEAEFEFRDGKIVRHVDSFDLDRWIKQAFGLAGTLLGWTGILHNTVRSKAAQQLAKFQSRRSS